MQGPSYRHVAAGLVGYLLRIQDPRHVVGCIFQDRAAICALVMVDDVLCGGCNIGDQVRIARLSANRISTCLTEAYLRTWNVIGPRLISAPEDEVASTWGDRVDILVHLPVEERQGPNRHLPSLSVKRDWRYASFGN